MHTKLWNKDFLLMLQGSAVSALGDILYSVAIGYWVYDSTGSSALMGIMSSISMFMTMLVMPFSGSIIDKCNRKAIIVGMDILRGLLMLAVGILAFSGTLTVPMVLTAAFLASACSVFFSPAVSTLMIDIIPQGDMVRGQSIQSGASTALSLVGKALSGALVAFLGVPLIILLNGISYLISALTEAFITVPKTTHQGEKVTAAGILAGFRLGFRAIGKQPFLRLFLPCAILLNFLGSGPFALMLPFVLEKGFTVEQYGYLMSISTAASFLGVCLLGAAKLKPRSRYACFALGFLLSSILFVFAYAQRSYIPLCILSFLACLANTIANGVGNAAIMVALPEDSRGAIIGLISAASLGGNALSTVAYGFLCDIFPVYLVFIAGSLLAIAPMAYVCLHKDTREFILNH